MTETLLNGLMMDDYPLSLTSIVERAERLPRRSRGRLAASRRRDSSHHARRLRRSRPPARRSRWRSSACGDGDRGRHAVVEPERAPRAVLRGPAMGAVIHTLNPRLIPDELAYIVDDAEDKVIVVDESLLEVFETFRHARDFEHVIVVSHTGRCSGRDARLRVADRRRRTDAVAGARRASRGGDVLHVGHDRPAQGRRVLAPGARAALAGCGAARPARRIGKGHDPSGRPDVPRQRVGPAVRRGRSPERRWYCPGPHLDRRERARPAAPTSG